jgi:hypothetical protein
LQVVALVFQFGFCNAWPSTPFRFFLLVRYNISVFCTADAQFDKRILSRRVIHVGFDKMTWDFRGIP